MALHLKTIIARSPTQIFAHISSLEPILARNPLLYTVSASQHTDSGGLSALVTTLGELRGGSVGCLTAPIPTGRPSGQQHIAVSLASFDEKHATLFRSTIPGRKAAQVGRWHAMHKNVRPDPEVPLDGSEDAPDWENALSQPYDNHPLPAELQSLNPDDVHAVLYLTDNAPEGLSSALSERFSSANKLGLIGTSTPFVTGRPYSLLHNKSIFSDGAVGVCLSSSTERPTPYSVFPGLEPITRPMLVTSSEGNLINSLDNANPSGLLLNAIKNHPSTSGRDPSISPDLRLYVGTLQQKAHGHGLLQLSYVMSGDPSRGSIALDTDAAPPEGTLVQVFLLPPSVSPDLLGEVGGRCDAGHPRRLAFATTELDDAEVADLAEASEDVGEPIVLEDTFLAASENGCIVSRAEERPWKCTVPGATMGFQWPA